jgi:hypothetical protein
MVLRFGQARGEDVALLIARKQYPKAIEIIKSQLSAQKSDPRIRLQLADVLVQAKRLPEAVAVLVPLADEYARDGFAAKAVAVLKRIQKIDPQRRDVETRLAALIEEKQKVATLPLIAAPPRLEFGFEEIQPGLELGIEPLESSSVAAPEIGIEADDVDAPVNVPVPVSPAPVEDRDLAFGDVEPLVLEPDAPAPELVLEPEVVVEVAAEPETSGPLNDDLFAQELLSVIDGVFPSSAEEARAEDTDGDQSGSARQIVVSPLFRDFSVDEMVAVIQGLKLLSYEAGEIIIGEGEPGESMYMLTAGRVKAFKRNAAGRNAPLGEMSEGAFFGEISVITGQPRTATVVAATSCELLELDRPALDAIAETHPHVMDVLREHASRRLQNQPRG